MISKLRQTIRPMSLFLAKPFAALGLHPNLVSFLAIPLALLSVYFFRFISLEIAFVLAVLAALMDLIDGAVAELTGKRSLFGNYFETMIDKYVEVILLIPFVWIFPLQAFLAIALGLIESYAKPRAALVVMADNRDWPAIGEHGERMLLILLGFGLLAFYPDIEGTFVLVEWVLWLLVLMTFIGGIQRIFYAKKLIEEGEKEGRILPYLKKGDARQE